mmetsp:Transcript_3785/g.8343  ORF Transcript_3785/g.8343 Transcript_3785/m.8343 type:complete len:205 (+) Transcript_3785:36-650(+)
MLAFSGTESQADSVGLLAALAEPSRSLVLSAGAFSLAFVLPRLVPSGGDPSSDKWYAALHKPSWQPPGFVFPLVWIPLKAMQTAAVALLWKNCENPMLPTGAYLVHIMLGSAWNYTFFARHNMKASVPLMAAFWVSCVGAEVACFAEGAATSGFLLIPTNIWATIAAALNIHTYILNKDGAAKPEEPAQFSPEDVIENADDKKT